MAPIRSFVVRIYRRGRGDLHGVVEDVKSGRSRPFHSIAELWDALRTPARGRRRGVAPRPDALPTPPASTD